MPRRRLVVALAAGVALAGAPPVFAQAEARPSLVPTSAPERVTFDEAVGRALQHNPSVREAAQTILRAQALLQQARAAVLPTLYAAAGTTVLDAARGFDGQVTQPRTQSALNATLSVPLLAAASWAEKNYAADQVRVATISAEETRREVAMTAAQAYLAVIAARRQQEITQENLDTARALEEYARARLDAGKGSRLNHLRSTQERATAEALLQAATLATSRAKEALGVAMYVDGPVDAAADPDLRPALPPSSDAWLEQRRDVRLFTAQQEAAERLAGASWTLFVPTISASFTPQYVTPAGLFEPAKTWRALFQLRLPVFDGSLFARKRLREADRESARIRLDALKVQARSELRVAQDAVAQTEQVVASTRVAADAAAEALRITEIAYRAGATSNIEVVQAQQGARNAAIGLAVVEDRLRQARLDLLDALGQFPQ
jgi:outer membrane protein